MDEFKFMERVVREAGKILKEGFYEEVKFSYKQDKTIVTTYDKEVEKFVFDELKKEFPTYGFIGEEIHKEEQAMTFILDPIDGTSNFARKIPFFAIALALRKDNEIIAGITYNPITDMFFHAIKGMGSYLKGKPLSCKNKPQKFVCYCHGKNKEDIENSVKFYTNIKLNYGDIRRLGASSLEMCYVACGYADAFLGFGLKIWDFASSSIIVKEAGCYYNENEKNNIIVINPAVKDEIMKYYPI